MVLYLYFQEDFHMKPCTPYALILLIFSLLFFSAFQGYAENTDVAARVNGVEISNVAFNNAVLAAQKQFAMVGVDEKENSGSVDIEQEVIDRLIIIELMLQDAKKRNIQVSDKTVEEDMVAFRTSFHTEEEFNDFLKKNNIDMAIIKKQFTKKATLQQFQRELLQELKKKVVISPEESKAFYKTNIEQFKAPEQVKASHILIKLNENADKEADKQALASIEKIRKSALAGEDFAKLAELHSQGPSSSRGGDLGFFDRKTMVKPFADAVFALKVNEISEVVKTSSGYHIIKLTQRKDAETIPFDKVKDKINDYLTQAKLEQAQRDYNSLLRENANIEINI